MGARDLQKQKSYIVSKQYKKINAVENLQKQKSYIVSKQLLQLQLKKLSAKAEILYSF